MARTALILASRSPRRAALLRQAGYGFEQLDPPFDDAADPHRHRPSADPSALAMDLALAKARSALDLVRLDGPDPLRHAVIIGADTICVTDDGAVVGQPVDVDDARRIIEGFVGRTHQVVTGVAMLRWGGEGGQTGEADSHCFADVAVVTVGQLSRRQLDEYLASGQWAGKAGAYNLFDRQAAGWPLGVEAGGDPTTVVGLPMRRLADQLHRWSIEPHSVVDA